MRGKLNKCVSLYETTTDKISPSFSFSVLAHLIDLIHMCEGQEVNSEHSPPPPLLPLPATIPPQTNSALCLQHAGGLLCTFNTFLIQIKKNLCF